MRALTDTHYWRDISTGDVFREETYSDGTVINPRPASGWSEASEQDYFVTLGAGEDAVASWVQRGIDAAGG